MSVYTRKGRGISVDAGMKRYSERLRAGDPPYAPWHNIAGSGIRDNMRGVGGRFLARNGHFPIVPDESTLFINPVAEEIVHMPDVPEPETTPTSIRRIRAGSVAVYKSVDASVSGIAA